MMARLNLIWCVLVASLFGGCSKSPEQAGVVCPTPKLSKTWLLSEVGNGFESHPNGSFKFPIVNQADHPVSLQVRSIGCSCYQVRKGDTRLKVDDQFEIGTGETETLTLVLPRPAFDRVSEYNFSLEYQLKPGEPMSLVSCQGVLTSIADVRVNPTLLTAEFVHDSPPQKVHMEVTRTARRREDAEQKISTQGWPEGAQVEEPIPSGDVVEVQDGLWKRTWRLTARIPKPELSATPQEMWPIRVGGSEPSSPHNIVQLMVRFRSGLSGPRIVHFGDVRVGQPVTRRIQILARDDQPFRITGPSDSNELLSLKSDSAEASKSHWGNLVINAREPGDLRQVIQVTTDHPHQSNLAIEVRANITAPVTAPLESPPVDKP